MRILFWTNHSRAKMRQHRLTESRVRRVLNHPKRVEEGIVGKTMALMQTSGSEKHPYEIWVMIQKISQKSPPAPKLRQAGKIKNQNYKSKTKNLANFKNTQSPKIKIISAWKYPGRTKIGELLPEGIMREFREASKF